MAACNAYGPRARCQSRGGQRAALGDGLVIPAGAVLVGQQHHAAGVVGASRGAAVLQQQQGQQAVDLALVGQQLAQQAGQADGLVAQVDPHQRVAAARRVALAEDQVDDPQHAGQPLG